MFDIICVVEIILGGSLEIRYNSSKKCSLCGYESKIFRCRQYIHHRGSSWKHCCAKYAMEAGAVVAEALRKGLNHFLSASEEKKPQTQVFKEIYTVERCQEMPFEKMICRVKVKQ